MAGTTAAHPSESATTHATEAPTPSTESAALPSESANQPSRSANQPSRSANQPGEPAFQRNESVSQRNASASSTRPRVLFLCTHNSARSQMAEGFLRAWAGGRFEAHSAGIEVTRVRPEAIAVMDELGIDLRGHRSKLLSEYAGQPFDWAITTCDEDCEACPVFPGATRRDYWVFDDPSQAAGSDEERLAVYRRVRDEIGARVKEFIGRRPEVQMPDRPEPPAPQTSRIRAVVVVSGK